MGRAAPVRITRTYANVREDAIPISRAPARSSCEVRERARTLLVMTNPTAADAMLTSAEVMEQLGIRKTAFYKLLNAGEIEAVDVSAAKRKRQVGERGARRTLRIPQSQVDAFKQRHAI